MRVDKVIYATPMSFNELFDKDFIKHIPVVHKNTLQLNFFNARFTYAAFLFLQHTHIIAMFDNYGRLCNNNDEMKLIPNNISIE